MKKILLGIIAINLTFISANLALRSMEPANAQLGAVQKVVICSESGYPCIDVHSGSSGNHIHTHD